MAEEGNQNLVQALEDAESKLGKLSLTKKVKQRKAQTEEEYAYQRDQFARSGPRINTENWLRDEAILSSLDRAKKSDRAHILHACERAYFQKEYEECLELVRVGEELFQVELGDDTENENMKSRFLASGKKVKKSNKVERHVVELLHIKEAALKKLHQQSE